MQCLQLGKSVVGFKQNQALWYNNAKKIIQKITFSKFQSPPLKLVLLATEGAYLAESTLGDYWGIGLSHKSPVLQDHTKWTGRNHFGQILMATRELLAKSSKTIYAPPAVTLQKGDILFAGDSNVGYIKKYANKSHTHSNIKYLPLPGHPIEGILNWAQFQILHKKQLPQKLILQCGTVNVLRYNSPLTIFASLTYLLKFLKFHAPTMQISFVSIPLTSRFNANQVIRRINGTAQIICSLFGVSFINTYPVFSKNNVFRASSLQKDGIHLSEDGCQGCLAILKDHFSINGSLN